MPHILIIEDDLNHLELLSEIIKYGGYKFWLANDSQVAFKIISEKSIDLIITDISLNNENGLDFINNLQKKNINLPVIVVSGSTDIDDRKKADSLNVFSFIRKPVDPEELLKMVSLALP